MEESSRITGSPDPPETQYGRWISCTWWLAVLVVMTGFTGLMKASVMVKDETGRVNSVKDVVARPNLIPIVRIGSTYAHLFSTSILPVEQKLWRQALRTGGLVTVAEGSSRTTYDLMLEEKAVTFTDRFFLFATAARLYPNGYSGTFYIGSEHFITSEFNMLVRKELDPQVRLKLHKRFRWILESGFPQRWTRNQMEQFRKTENSQGRVGATSMKLTDVGAIFYLFLIGLAFSVLAMILEIAAGIWYSP